MEIGLCVEGPKRCGGAGWTCDIQEWSPLGVALGQVTHLFMPQFFRQPNGNDDGNLPPGILCSVRILEGHKWHTQKPSSEGCPEGTVYMA